MIYAVGDIHGHFEKLRTAHALIEADKRAHPSDRATIIHIGDLCDRGPQSSKVIQYLSDGMARGEDWLVLKGNHDQMFLDFMDGGDGSNPRLSAGVNWLNATLGGKSTLASYGLKKSLLESNDAFMRRARSAVPEDHLEFLRRLPVWLRAEGKIFVHAGIRPGFPIEAQDEMDLLWIRDDFLWHFGDHEALIVHGHTPVEEPVHYGNRINVDTGAGWGNPLVPVALDGDRAFALREEGREEMPVPKQRPKPVMRR